MGEKRFSSAGVISSLSQRYEANEDSKNPVDQITMKRKVRVPGISVNGKEENEQERVQERVQERGQGLELGAKNREDRACACVYEGFESWYCGPWTTIRNEKLE